MNTETYQLITAIAGVIISVGAFLWPWYKNIESKKKVLVMLGINLLVFAGIVGLNCAGVASQTSLPIVPCTKESIMQIVMLFIGQLGANQGTYLLLRKIF